jgi:hypothetical protein
MELSAIGSDSSSTSQISPSFMEAGILFPCSQGFSIWSSSGPYLWRRHVQKCCLNVHAVFFYRNVSLVVSSLHQLFCQNFVCIFRHFSILLAAMIVFVLTFLIICCEQCEFWTSLYCSFCRVYCLLGPDIFLSTFSQTLVSRTNSLT